MGDPNKKKPWYYYTVFVYCGLHDVLLWLAVSLIRGFFGGEKLHWQNGLWGEMKKDSWFTSLGICLGHGGLYAKGHLGDEGIDTPTEFHEQEVHVEQFEAAMFRAFLIGLSVFILLTALNHFAAGLTAGVVYNLLGWWFYVATNWFTAKVRGEDYYWGSHHEESAYAQTEKWEREHGTNRENT